MKWLLDCQNVTVVRGGRAVVRNLNLQIGLGESVAILGPNGAGKSTLIKLLDRELYPAASSSGRFMLMGESHWDVSQLRRWLGIVTNDMQALFGRDMTGEEMLLSGFFSSVGLWPHHKVTSAMRRKTASLLRWLEIPHLAKRSILTVSSGEARRLLIGRALVHEPKALLLDEPCTSLDLRSSHSFRELLRKIAKQGTGILLVTHYVDDIIPEIRRVLLLREGSIWKDDLKTALLTPRTLSALFGVPIQLSRRRGYFHAW